MVFQALRARQRMVLRRAVAVAAGKLSGVATRAAGRGGGTALPGLVATRVDPTIVGELARQLPSGSILVSGTNGKTTTARILGELLSDAGFRPLRNHSGSNLMRGLASALVQEADILGNLPVRRGQVGLFEVDEAALPQILQAVAPDRVLLLDLFRDQLDRYGEVAAVARRWEEAAGTLSDSTTVVANADDPLVAEVARAVPRAAVLFGIESAAGVPRLPGHASDVKACPRCGGPIRYTSAYVGHLGHYACDQCGFARPEPAIRAVDVQQHGMKGSTFLLEIGGEKRQVWLPLPGMYNVYNALAAAATATTYGVELEKVVAALGRITPAFGRMERLQIEGRPVILALVKNPTGLNEVLRTLITEPEKLHLLVMLNDNIADGRDVSWIWDADVEVLQDRVEDVVFSGIRAEDIALRFKYAGIPAAGSRATGQRDVKSTGQVVRDTEAAFRRALSGTPEGATLYIVPTYTAMLDIRNTLSRLGHVKPYWEE